MINKEILREYQDFAKCAQKLLQENTQWKERYAGYAEKLLKNKEIMAMKRKTLGSENQLDPLHCYTSIGAIKGEKEAGFDFDLRFLGQSVGNIAVKDGKPMLHVPEEKSDASKAYFGYDVGKIDGEIWNDGDKAKSFKDYYADIAQHKDKMPRQQEHMVESALFTELGKKQGDGKALKHIQPITCVSDVRLHMKTALCASKAAKSMISLSDQVGEIDVFCRRRVGNRSRLTVIEVKDENKGGETFHLAIKQASAYAVFIRELARSKSGADWMELWGMGNQPWKEEGFTGNAVAAMPKGKTTEFPFAGMELELENEQSGIKDKIELHYIAFLGEDKPRDGQDVRFETSL